MTRSPHPRGPAAAAPAPQRGRLSWPLYALAAVAIAAIVVLVTVRDLRTARGSARAELLAVSDLRLAQVQAWRRELTSGGALASTSRLFANLYLGWADQADAKALATLVERAAALRRAIDADAMIVIDDQGQVVAGDAAPGEPVADALRTTLSEAMTQRRVLDTGFYSPSGSASPRRIDIVVPLLETGTPARGALVFRADPRRRLFGLLSSWPVPSASGETVLWQASGTEMVGLNPVRFRPGSAGEPRIRLADSSDAIARAVRGEVAVGEAFEGIDYRGQPVLAVVRRIGDSSGWLVAKKDRRDIDAPAWESAAWAAGVGAVALIALAIGLRASTQRRALDETRRVQAEQAERLRSLQLLEAISENSDDAIYTKDLDGRYITYNRAAAAQLGRTPEQVIGSTDAELFDADTAAALRENDRRVLESGRNQSFTERLRLPAGERITMATKGPLRDGSQRVVGLFGISRDVTGQERTRAALAASEAHYRSVVASLDEGILVFDADAQLIGSNPAAARLLGLGEGEAVGPAALANWVPVGPDGKPLPADRLLRNQVAATGQAQHGVEMRSRGPDGAERWFSVNAQPVCESDGPVVAVVLSFVDITERRALAAELAAHRHHLEELVAQRTGALRDANAQLADAERFVRMVADNLPGRIAYWDAEGRCRFANRQWYDWFGKTPGEVIGRHAAEILGAAYFERQRARFEATLAGESFQFERAEVGRGGESTVHLVHYIADRRDDGRIHGGFVMAFDISALKRAEAELVQARDAAEAASRAKSAFLANMSHEIRTPMNAIIGLAHLMERDVREARQRERLDKIKHSAHHLLQVINDILDLSKIEAGRLGLESIDFSLDAVLARTFEMVADGAREKGLELIVDTDHLPDRLTGDPTRLSQALLNLLANAVKFTERGFVRLTGELLDEQGERLHVRFTVQDTGPGIAPERQRVLFNAFEQLDGTTTRRYGGTGLGLALTRRIAELMGGASGVESEPGQGSRFWFSAVLGRAGEEPVPPPTLSGRRVLLVDDLPEARSAIGERLHLFGMRVDDAAGGAQALEAIERAARSGVNYDALLIDWRMAPMNGIELLQRIRERLGEGVPPSVLVTAYDDTTMRRDALEARFDSVLVKPITASTLHDAMLRLLRREPETLAERVPAGVAENALRRRGGRGHVLVAEDNAINQEVALELLRAVGLRADLAEDGDRVVAMALEARPDLVLMDMQMPGRDGMAAARELRRLGFAAPIIAMTANAFGEDREACLAAGMNDHIAKPVDPEHLYTILLRWLPAAPAADPAPADDSSSLLAGLAPLPGFDTYVALRSAGERIDTLVRLLHRFAAHYAAGVPDLVQPGGDERIAIWRRHAHSLQGACGAIGAVALQAQAQQFEAALRRSDSAAPLEGDAARLHGALRALAAELTRALPA